MNNVSKRLETGFRAGNVKHCFGMWEKITSDRNFLTMIKEGIYIQFTDEPTQMREPVPISFSEDERMIIDAEIEKFLKKEIIVECDHTLGEFISTIFIHPKKDGAYRVILNLKKLNEHVEYHHFKMDTIHTCISLMEQDCYMASIDLRDAYYTIPVAKHHQKYLKFRWHGKLYKYTCMENGLACAPRIFTKILKVVFSHLRKEGHISSGYLDDIFLLGMNKHACAKNFLETKTLLTDLGFFIHEVKSVSQPVQELQQIGFVLQSKDMTVSITETKHQCLIAQAQCILGRNTCFIRDVARLIGMMVANIPAVEFGELFYRQLEIEKAWALKVNFGNFDTNMTVSELAKKDIQWWIHNAHTSVRKISHGKPELTLQTDASLQGWGAALDDISTGGRWDCHEAEKHINVLELKQHF